MVVSNRHVGEHSAGFEGIHGSRCYGMTNQDEFYLLDFCVANKLAFTYTIFRKNKSRLITFSFGSNHAQMDFILFRTAQLKNIKNTKVISSEDCIT